MSALCHLVCWMRVWFMLRLWEASAGGFALTQDCIPTTDSSDPVGLHGYRRYFANDSLIGRPVPCTREDKICFRHNLVFDPINDRCEPLLWACGDRNAVRVVDKTELEHRSGRVLGSCPEHDDPCPGYRMAYDDICYRKEIVRDVICGCNAIHTRHILGGVECRPEPTTPISVHQPEEDGSCLIPDLRNPNSRRSMFLDNPYSPDQDHVTSLECSHDTTQYECFSKNKIWVLEYEGCHKLLEQGPCAEDHVVALDLEATSKGQAEGTCVHVRGGCPKGYKRMAFDGECHEDREIAIVAPGKIFFNQFGTNVVIVRDVPAFLLIPVVRYSKCIILAKRENYPENATTNAHALPPCGIDDKGKCTRYEVENEPPKPEF